MRKTLAILFASTALTAGIGFPAWSAMHDAARFEGLRDAVLDAGRDLGVVLASDDDDDRDHGRQLRRGDDDDDDDKDEDDDDNDSRGGNVSAPAPAGSVAPPNNGLFGNGATPKAQVN